VRSNEQAARGRAEEHEPRGPLVDASGHGGELADEAGVCGGGLLRGMDGKHQMFISLQLSDSGRNGGPWEIRTPGLLVRR